MQGAPLCAWQADQLRLGGLGLISLSGSNRCTFLNVEERVLLRTLTDACLLAPLSFGLWPGNWLKLATMKDISILWTQRSWGLQRVETSKRTKSITLRPSTHPSCSQKHSPLIATKVEKRASTYYTLLQNFKNIPKHTILCSFQLKKQPKNNFYLISHKLWL